MSAAVYLVRLSFDSLRLSMDLTQAAAPIRYEGPDPGEWIATPFQTADARHRALDAAVLVVRYFGRGYWLSPDEDAPDEDDEAIRGLIESVECEDEDDEEDEERA